MSKDQPHEKPATIATKVEQSSTKVVADGSTKEIIQNNPTQLQKLLSTGLNPNSMVDKCSLLNLSIKSRNFESFKILVENGADLNLVDEAGQLPITLICQTPDVKYLDLALKKGIKLKINQSEPDKLELISQAAMHGNSDILDRLVANGLDINVKAENNNSALHLAVATVVDEHIGKCLYFEEKFESSDQEYKQRLSEYQDFETMQNAKLKWLITAGIDINIQNDFGDTPLHLAIKSNLLKVIKTLMELKANVNSKNNNNETPLHIALQHSHPPVIEMLLKAGANNINAATTTGLCPIHLAAESKYPKILEMLVKDGADVRAVNSAGQTALHLAASNIFIDSIYLLLENGAELEAKDKQNQTPAHMVAQSTNSEMMYIFAEYAANYEAVNDNGDYPLHFAARSGVSNNIKFFHEIGISMNVRNESFSTPLHDATLNQNIENVKTLVSLGADKKAVDEFDYTPLELVADSGNDELIEVLK